MSLDLAALRAAVAENGPVVRILIARAAGSAPRGAGTSMLVWHGGDCGTIGGGTLEHRAIREAWAILAEGRARQMRAIPLGPALGQCCGGVVGLRIALLAQDPPAGWVWPAARFTLHLYGAGHVGRAIVRLLVTLPCRVRWIDARDGGLPAEPLPAHIATEALTGDADPAEVAGAVAGAAPGDWHLVLTHSHALDLAIVHAVLARGDAGWLGLIGSRSKRASFERRLRERGHDAAALAAIVCPIGLPGLVGKEPEVIALAVVAQLWQQVGGHGRSAGAALSSGPGLELPPRIPI
jgi:xanthine dehydrogenase accessory factor